jgi:hypothetical protein
LALTHHSRLSDYFLHTLRLPDNKPTLRLLRAAIPDDVPKQEQFRRFGSQLKHYWLALESKNILDHVDASYTDLLRIAVEHANWTRVAVGVCLYIGGEPATAKAVAITGHDWAEEVLE